MGIKDCFYCLALGCLTTAIALGADGAGSSTPQPGSKPGWNAQAAARYLDQREIWWQAWKNSQRDHETVCVSCHTVLPYALARPTLRRVLGEKSASEQEQAMIAGVIKRVSLWDEVKPFYDDAKYGPGKAEGSRTSEAVLNAVVLASHDAETGHLTEPTRTAFRTVWALQHKTGESAGGWTWLNFHNSPWEADESPYWGASLVALAVGIAPDHMLKDPEIKENLDLLRGYLQREYAAQPMVNKITLLWASGKWPELLSKEDRGALIDSFFSLQKEDGGWSLSTLNKYERHDKTPLETKSDGFATGLISLALEAAGVPQTQPQLAKAIHWLEANQDPEQGRWVAYSVNRQQEPTADGKLFMSDAATGYTVLALSKAH